MSQPLCTDCATILEVHFHETEVKLGNGSLDEDK